MAFQVLNLSVDCIDFQPISSTASADFNQLNSFSEYISEVMLGHKNQYPEFSGHTKHKSHWQKHMGMKPFIPINTTLLAVPMAAKRTLIIPTAVSTYDEYLNIINPPPPRHTA
jgi:hypothetical protein